MKNSKVIIHFLLFIFILEIAGIWVYLLPENSSISYLYIDLISSFLQLIFVCFFINKISKEKIHLKNISIKFYLIAMFLGISFVYFQYFLDIIYYFDIPKRSIILKYNFSELKKIGIISSVLIVPITEELFFRYYLQDNLQKTKGIKYAILITTILFSIIHIPLIALFVDFIEFSLHHAYIVFFGSIISGLLFYKSKSIGPSILFHAFWNLIIHITYI